MYCKVEWISETGPVRSHNEDCVTVTRLDGNGKNLVAVLADGMGGHNAGEIASSMACKNISAHVLEHYGSNNIPNVLEQAFQHAHTAIRNAGETNEDQKGMGTTAVAVVIKDNLLYFGHIGDSRLYQYSNPEVTQLTTDHTLVNQMHEKGEINKVQRDAHPMRNVLLQALGTVAAIRPQIWKEGISLRTEDKYLLCSDGIYDLCSEAELNDLLRMEDTAFLLECIRAVAIRRRASDNFSAIIISFSRHAVPVSPVTREQNIML